MNCFIIMIVYIVAGVHSYSESFLGGLAAVIYTDAAQTVIMLIGALILMVFSM